MRTVTTFGVHQGMLRVQGEPILSRAPQGKMPSLASAFQAAIAQSSAADDPLAANLRLRLTDSRAASLDPAARTSTVRRFLQLVQAADISW